MTLSCIHPYTLENFFIAEIAEMQESRVMEALGADTHFFRNPPPPPPNKKKNPTQKQTLAWRAQTNYKI